MSRTASSSFLSSERRIMPCMLRRSDGRRQERNAGTVAPAEDARRALLASAAAAVCLSTGAAARSGNRMTWARALRLTVRDALRPLFALLLRSQTSIPADGTSGSRRCCVQHGSAAARYGLQGEASQCRRSRPGTPGTHLPPTIISRSQTAATDQAAQHRPAQHRIPPGRAGRSRSAAAPAAGVFGGARR